MGLGNEQRCLLALVAFHVVDDHDVAFSHEFGRDGERGGNGVGGLEGSAEHDDIQHTGLFSRIAQVKKNE